MKQTVLPTQRCAQAECCEPVKHGLRWFAAVLLCGGLVLPPALLAHGTEKHGARAPDAIAPNTADTASAQAPASAAPKDAPPSQPQADAANRATAPRATQHAVTPASAPMPPPTASEALSLDTIVRDLDFAQIPTLHPVAVHVPVTFIPLALLFAVIGLLRGRRITIGLALGFTLGGLAGALVAAFPLHPHTAGLPRLAQETLDKHDLFAYGTLWLTSLGALVGLACLWKPSVMLRTLMCLALAASTLTVSITAHYGGTLAYVHGIGVQGRFLIEH